MLPTTNTLRRLSIAKEMYIHGLNHARKSYISDLIHAILDFDYCVEMIIKTILQDSGISLYHGRGSRRRPKNFPELTNDLMGVFSTLRHTDMRDLHDLRNNVQHRAIVPSDHEVQRFGIAVKMFFDDICLICYDDHIDYDGISLSIFVPSVIEKIILDKLEEYLHNGEYGDAYSYAREVANYHKLLLRKNMNAPRRWTSLHEMDLDDFDAFLNGWIKETDATLNWLVDRISLQEYYNDINKLIGNYWPDKYSRKTKTSNEAEEVRTLVYNFIIGTQRFIEEGDLNKPHIFDINILEKTDVICKIQIGYGSVENLVQAKLDISPAISDQDIKIDLPLDNGVHEIEISNLEEDDIYLFSVSLRNSSAETNITHILSYE